MEKERAGELAEEVRRYLVTPEGREALRRAMERADEAVRQLQEARKLPPDWRDFRVTL